MRSGYFKETFAEQLALTGSTAERVRYGLLLLVLIALPGYSSPFFLGHMTTIMYTLVAALGLNVLTGFTGLVSLGNVAFLILGAYGYAIGVTRLGLHPLLALLLSGVVAAVAGLVVGLPSLRLKGLYLAITTLAFTYLVNALISAGGDFTGGSLGITVPRPTMFGIDFSSDRSLYWLCLVVAVVVLLAVLNIRRSRLGRAFMAIRDNETAAVSMGISLSRYKLLSFLISSFIVGLAGALMVLYINFANIDGFPFLLSIEGVAILIVGGIGSVLGTVIGTVFIMSLPEVSRLLLQAVGSATGHEVSTGALEMKGLIYGAVIVFFLLLDPRGLVGIWIDVKRIWVNRPVRF